MTTQPVRRWISIALAGALLLALLSVAGMPMSLASPPTRQSQAPVATAQPSPGGGLFFVENAGQFPQEARFLVYGSNQGRLWLAEDALWLMADGGDEGQGAAVRLTFPGANHHPKLEPFGLRETVFNYYHGNDPAHWRARVPVWSGVRYVDLYPGADLEIAGQDKRWTWRLVTHHAPRNIDAVQLRVEGVDDVALVDGVLHLSTAAGILDLPLLSSDGRSPAARPAISGDEGHIFTVTSPFANLQSPISYLLSPQDNPSDLLYSTFLGGDNNDKAFAMAVDGDGAAYVTGETQTPTFPTTPGAYDSSLAGEQDVFVAKLNAAGNDLVYSTFIGGDETTQGSASGELVHDIAVDGSGAAHICGETTASDFPTTSGAFDPSYNQFGPYVVKLDSSGALAYGTFFPSAPPPEVLTVNAIAVDDAGMIYAAGEAWETLPTTPGAYDRTFDSNGNAKAYVIKLNPAGQGQSDLLYGTYVGGIYWDHGTDIAVDGSGVVYVIGSTEGEFPTTAGAYDTTFNGVLPPTCCPIPRNVVFFKLNPAGNGASDLLYSTYLDGTATVNEGGYGIAVDAAGIVYLTGLTWSKHFPTTPGAYDTKYNGAGDAFVSKLNPAGNGAADLLYSTFLGGTYIDGGGSAIAVDDAGDIYVVGDTSSSDFPTTPDAFQLARVNYTDLFVTRLRPQGNGQADLVYSTYLGGNYLDYGRGIAVGQEESVYLTGYTGSSDFPTTAGAYDTTFGGGTCGSYSCYDAFVARLRVMAKYTIAGRVLDGDGQPIPGLRIAATAGYSATADASGAYTLTNVLSGTYTLTPAAGYFWSPQARTVTVPPDASGQDFTGRNILKQGTPDPAHALGYGEPLTYTVRLAYPDDRDVVLYDPVPTYTTYLSGSLSAPAGVAYYTATNAISGTLSLSATVPATVTFAVRVEVTGTITSTHHLVNRACVYPAGGSVAGCEWSDEVLNFTYVWPVYLPLVVRDYGP